MRVSVSRVFYFTVAALAAIVVACSVILLFLDPTDVQDEFVKITWAALAGAFALRLGVIS